MARYKPNDEIILLSISRLESWKRIDRTIKIVSKLIKTYKVLNIKYIILGDGLERNKLENLVKTENIENHVIFKGSIHNFEVKKYLNIADIFISTYDLSNVGNPLLEAIKANKIIFTLNNGDTNSWIQHKINGFIYDINNYLIDNMAMDLYELIHSPDLQKNIIENIKKTEKEKLWTWNERLNAEVREVEKLL